MKHVYLILVLAQIAFSASCQITINYSDMPSAGWSQPMAVDVNPQHLSYGNSGPNQIYDLRSLQRSYNDTLHVDSLTATQLTLAPAATHYIKSAFYNSTYIHLDSSGYSEVAVKTKIANLDTLYSFTPAITKYKFPISYGDSLSGSDSLTYFVAGTRFTPPYSNYGTVRVRIRSSYSATVDGWGKLLLPGCSYDCLRVKRIIYDTIITDWKYTVVIYHNIDTIIRARVECDYLTKEANGSALRYFYDSDLNLSFVGWALSPSSNTPQVFTDSIIIGGVVSFADTSPVSPLATLFWDFGDNTSRDSITYPIHRYDSNGVYRVCLTQSLCHSDATYCDSVVITALSPGADFALIAIDDTVNVIVGDTVRIDALLNDFNPDNDSVCIDSVWNVYAPNTTTSSCNGIVYYSQDTNYLGTGADTIYYKVCDNDSSTLCDTAKVIVNIMRRLPVAIISHVAGWYDHLAFFCGQGYLRDSSKYYDPATVVWHLKINPSWCLNCTDSTILYGDSSMLTYPFDSISAWEGYRVLKVCLTVSNYSGSSTICDSFDIWCEAINEVDLNKFKIYPNPANENVIVDLSKSDLKNDRDLYLLEIFDVVGQKLRSVPVTSIQQSVSVKDLCPGNYIIGLTAENRKPSIIGKFEVVR